VKEEEEIDMSVYDRLYKVEVYTGEAGINANVSKNILFLYLHSLEGEGGYIVLPLSICPSIRPRYFSSHFSQQLSMAEI
jgi:hypothetical protein